MGKHGIGTHRTRIAQDNGSTVVTYHFTQVVSFNNLFIHLRNGGYYTVTTKRRMNEASVVFGLDYRVWQTNHIWHVYYKGRKYPYRDRMTLDRHSGLAYTYDGKVIDPIVE